MQQNDSKQRLEILIKREFPSLEKMIYVNHAAISPWPRVTADAMAAFADENLQSGSLHYPSWLQRQKHLRDRIAGMLNATGGEDIALLKNTSEGICIVANGIDWKDGDNIVTARGEFISNQLAWQALSAKGVELRKVDILNCDDPESALLNAMDDRTRVLTVSSVQWNSGFRLDLRKLGKACRNSNTLFFVDAIQQFGALQIDVQDCGIDVLAASAHKWMMGPEGIAIFYCNAKTRKKLVLRQYGWLMLNDPFRYDLPDREPTSSARRFEAGTPNNIGQAGLFASLGLLSDVGHEVVERLVLSNTAKLMAALHQIKGVTVQSRTETSRHSGIVSFAANGIESEQLRRKLAKMNVHVAVRGSAVRLSPHFYQCSETIDQLLNCIELAIRNDKIH